MSDFTKAKNDRSITNAMKVTNAAKNESNEAINSIVRWVDKLNAKAKNMKPVTVNAHENKNRGKGKMGYSPTGWTRRTLVNAECIVVDDV